MEDRIKVLNVEPFYCSQFHSIPSNFIHLKQTQLKKIQHITYPSKYGQITVNEHKSAGLSLVSLFER